MELIIASDEMQRLEEEFGPRIRLIGSWYSDNEFAYTSIPLSVVSKAVEILRGPAASDTVSALHSNPNQLFYRMLERYGLLFIEALLTAEHSSEVLPGSIAVPDVQWVTEWQL